tara:strand:+ start:421 stop:807 length:387 start_codon:yes stop_codon:yes gene_type:complete
MNFFNKDNSEKKAEPAAPSVPPSQAFADKVIPAVDAIQPGETLTFEFSADHEHVEAYNTLFKSRRSREISVEPDYRHNLLVVSSLKSTSPPEPKPEPQAPTWANDVGAAIDGAVSEPEPEEEGDGEEG